MITRDLSLLSKGSNEKRSDIKNRKIASGYPTNKMVSRISKDKTKNPCASEAN
jgi:hypothetical protein